MKSYILSNMASSSLDTCKRSGSNESSPERSPKKFKTEKGEKRLQEEKHFFKLMNLVLDTTIALKNVKEEDISMALPNIIKSFSSFKFMDINLSKWENSCAYLFRYGSHGAGLTRFKTLEALQNCKDLVSKFKMPDLTIVSLGGGPGNDAIGLCSALYEYQFQNRLNIIATDSVCEWSTYMKLIEMFINEGNYGNASDLFQQNKVNLSFQHAPLPGNKSFQVLEQADVILMAKFLSSFGKDDWKLKVESVYKNMKHDAFILFIDSPFEDSLWEDFEVMYLTEEVNENDRYISSSTTERFHSNDSVRSKARVAVLRKK